MKLLLVLAVVALLVWLVRGDRRRAVAARRKAPPAGPVAMVACSACGLHLPAGDALPGPDGRPFCCAAHRAAAH